MSCNDDVYIKTGTSSGYIPTTFISDEEYEFIIVPNDQSYESSGEVKNPVLNAAHKKAGT